MAKHEHNFQILGLQRSGTNFLEQLLKDNCEQKRSVGIINMWHQRQLNGIWKHAYDVDPEDLKIAQKNEKGLYRPEIERQQTDSTRAPAGSKLLDVDNPAITSKNYIWIHKHPYSWLESVTNKSVDILNTYKWISARREDQDNEFVFFNDKNQALNTLRLCELYREHTLYWFSVFKRKPALNHKRIMYEQLIQSKEDTQRHMDEISEQFNFPLKKELLIADRVSQSAKWDSTRHAKYTKIEIRKFSWKQIQKYNEVLTTPVFRRLGYKMITTHEEYMQHKVAP